MNSLTITELRRILRNIYEAGYAAGQGKVLQLPVDPIDYAIKRIMENQ